MKKTTPVQLFVWSAVVVFMAWVGTICGLLPVNETQLESLFTGLGFAGLVAAFLHERQQAEGSDEDHAALIAEMKAQARAMREATLLNAINARITAYNQQIAEVDGPTTQDIAKRLRSERHSMLLSLDKVLQKSAEPFVGERW